MTPTPSARLDLRFWLVTAAAVAGMAATASLGRWQLARAAHKEALQAAIDERSRQSPLDGAMLTAAAAAPGGARPMQEIQHRTVVLQGQWLAQHTVYLDNRQLHAKQGFFVFTPLQLADSPTVVLVQRGWAPRNFQQRTALPAVTTPPGTVQVVGRIAPPPARLYEFSEAENTRPASRIRQNLDLAAFRAETGLALADVSVLQTDAASEGLLRDWPAVSLGSERNRGYAFQWFGLSGLMALLYVWFQLVRRFTRPSSHSTP